jgi:hypothetical protein
MQRTTTLCIFLLFFLLARPVFAASFTFDGAPSSIYFEDNFAVNFHLQVNNSSGKSYFIKGAFSYSQTPTSYFGYTKNNEGSWHNGSDKNGYYKITMDENGEWEGAVEVKLDPYDSGYKGSGEYNFKLGRYTEGGSSPTYCDKESEACSVAVIKVTAPTPTSTPTPTSPPSPTPTKTPTPTKSQISYLTPTGQALGLSATNALSKKTATKTAAPKDIPSPILKANDAFEKKTPDKKTGEVLVEGVSRNNFHLIALGIGVLTLSCAILFFIKIKRRQTL